MTPEQIRILLGQLSHVAVLMHPALNGDTSRCAVADLRDARSLVDSVRDSLASVLRANA